LYVVTGIAGTWCAAWMCRWYRGRHSTPQWCQQLSRRHPRQPQPGEPAVYPVSDRQQPRHEAWPDPQAGTAGARRPGPATVHRPRSEPALADLDREDLPPPPTSGPPRPAHASRVRDPPTSRSRGLTIPTQMSQRDSGQTRTRLSTRPTGTLTAHAHGGLRQRSPRTRLLPALVGPVASQRVGRPCGWDELAGPFVAVSQGAHTSGGQMYLPAATYPRRILVHGCVVHLGRVGSAGSSRIGARVYVGAHGSDHLTPLACERASAPGWDWPDDTAYSSYRCTG
jgi:hypothetical protein